MVLITLVVVGHAIVLVALRRPELRVYDFLYYLHIPAFVLVTGYLSRSFTLDTPAPEGLFTTLAGALPALRAALLFYRTTVAGEGDAALRAVAQPALADVVPRSSCSSGGW